jgi:4-hydroxy-tetrahydrodipicolinate reductase
MKIAIVGYGKMGKIIEQKALKRGHDIGPKINSTNIEDFNSENFKDVDIAIEFTGPDYAFRNILNLVKWTIPVVSGSTGWLQKIDDVKKELAIYNGAFFYASNFSIAVNVFFELNKILAFLTKKDSNFKIRIEEIHHLEKKDAPSGTAITLANQIIENNDSIDNWSIVKTADGNGLTIDSKREDGVPGTHIVTYSSAFDEIEIKHVAKSRDSFAEGAVLAAEWLIDKKGYFGMEDMLGL